MASRVPCLPTPQRDDLTLQNSEDILRDHKLRRICVELFKVPGNVARLREAAKLGNFEAPSWPEAAQFLDYTNNFHGAGAEALALTLWHLAAERHWSAKKCERYRYAAEWAYKSVRDFYHLLPP